MIKSTIIGAKPQVRFPRGRELAQIGCEKYSEDVTCVIPEIFLVQKAATLNVKIDLEAIAVGQDGNLVFEIRNNTTQEAMLLREGTVSGAAPSKLSFEGEIEITDPEQNYSFFVSVSNCIRIDMAQPFTVELEEKA